MIGQALAAGAGAAPVPFWQQPETWLLVAFAIFVGLMARPMWSKITGGLDEVTGESLISATDPMIVPLPSAIADIGRPQAMGAHRIEFGR